VDPVTGVVTYTPDSSFAGTDNFQYQVTDGAALSGTATVTIDVEAAIVADSGTVVPGAGTTLGRMTSAQIDALPADDTVDRSCVGGCFDFQVTGLAPGAQVRVSLLPLTVPIPSEGEISYKKVIGGVWTEFDTAAGDTIASGSSLAGASCSTDPADYTVGLNGGHDCIMLTITDGGSNDGDGAADGTVTDPGGVAAIDPEVIFDPSTRDSFDPGGSFSCTINRSANPASGGGWWLIGTFLAFLGMRRKIRRRGS
jgi:hypothetical protein